jgi:Initiator Replication protein
MTNNLATISAFPVATGDPWVPSVEDPATVPVPLPIIIVGVEGSFTEQDRKLWTFLLHAVFKELGDKVIHELTISDINRVFREHGARHDANWIWESVQRLADTRVRWENTQGDKRYKGIASLLDAEVSEDTKGKGSIRFNFPPLLVPILKDPRRFARLRTHFLIELSGKYTVTLYEL